MKNYRHGIIYHRGVMEDVIVTKNKTYKTYKTMAGTCKAKYGPE